MFGRINRVEAGGHNRHGRNLRAEGGAMGSYVDAVSQPTDNHHIAHLLGQFVDEAAGEVDAVRRGVACADNADHAAVVQVKVSATVNHQRGVLAFQQAPRIARVGEIYRLQVVGLDENSFVDGLGEHAGAVVVGVDARLGLREIAEPRFRQPEELTLAADHTQQFAAERQVHAAD